MLRFLLLSCSIVGATGCGQPKETPILRHIVSGRVSVGGVPLESGTIVFNPVDVTQVGGPASSRITNGLYSEPVPPGKYNATFSAGTAQASGSSDARTVGKSPIPDKYKKGVPVEVTGPKADLDFDLK